MSGTLKVFLIDDMQRNAPFVIADYARGLPMEIVPSSTEAEVIVGRRRFQFDDTVCGLNKRHILWTHEPFFDTSRSWVLPDFFPMSFADRTLYVFNAHNGQVYTDNFYVAPASRPKKMIEDESGLNVPYGNKIITLAATYKMHKLRVADGDLALYGIRSRLGEELHKIGAARVIGRGWPEGIAEGESRITSRHATKAEFLSQSNFNLCYESAVVDYYVSEKIWESIGAGCLPIYYSNGTIYQTFPRDSFIDGRQFEDAGSLVAFLARMPFDEYKKRLNMCIDVFNRSVRLRLRDQSRRRSTRRVADLMHTWLGNDLIEGV